MSLVPGNDGVILISDKEETITNFSSEKTITNDRFCRPLNKKKYTKHGRPRESYIWDYFIEEGDERICQVKVPVSLEHPNGLCGKRLPNVSSTSNSISHLLKFHSILPPTEQQKVY